MKKFHITITDNVTGETLVSLDSGAIVAGVDASDEIAKGLCYLACNAIDLASTLDVAQQMIDETKAEYPEIAALIAAANKSTDKT